MKDKNKNKSKNSVKQVKVENNFNEEIAKEIYAKDLSEKSRSNSKSK